MRPRMRKTLMMRHVLALILALLAVSAGACSRDPQEVKAEAIANGDAYVAKKDHAAAIIEYRKAVAQDERSGEARLKLGLAYRTIGDMKNAYQHLIRAADLMPQSTEALLAAGSVRLVAEQYDEARGLAQKALERDPKNVEALIMMGTALAGLKDLDGAITHVEEALGEDPRLALAYGNVGLYQIAQGKREAAEATFKRAVSADPKSIPARLNLGNFYLAAGRHAEAEQQFKNALEIDPQSATGARALAAFYLNGGQRPEAEPLLKIAATTTQGKLVLADYYTTDRKTRQAAEVLEELAKQTDGYVPALVRLAAIDFQEGRKEQAYAKISEVLERHDGNPLALETKARFLLREQRFKEAIEVADSILKGNPNAPAALFVRASSLEGSSRSDLALVAFRDLLQKVPSSLPIQLKVASLYLEEGNPGAALNLLGTAVKSHPESGYAHYLHGQALLMTGDIAAAERVLTGMAKALPKSAEVQTWVGLLYQKKNDAVRAREAFERGAALDKTSPVVVAGLLSADLGAKDYTSARARIESVLATNPKDVRLLLLAGNTYATMNDHQKAQTAYESVLQLDPANMEAFGKLGLLYHSQRRLGEARKKYEELVRRHERPVMALTFLGMIAELEQNPRDARTSYERAVALDANAAVAANNLAWIYAESGENLDVALQLAQTAKARFPNVPEVNDTLGWVYYKRGLTNQAVTFLEEAIKLGPPKADVHYRLGLAYLKKGDQGSARASFERALKVNPRFTYADDARRTLQNLQG